VRVSGRNCRRAWRCNNFQACNFACHPRLARAMAMAMQAGAAVMGAVGHLANMGQIVEMGQSHVYQKEQISWARRAYRLDKHAMRIDLLSAAKEDIRDHYETFASRIDTMLLVHTLLFTFALATLQFSDQFVLKTKSECPHCLEVRFHWLEYIWVFLIGVMLIFPFWSMVSTVWCKLQLDNWLEKNVATLNHQFRSTLRGRSLHSAVAPLPRSMPVEAEADEAEQQYIDELAQFVVLYQWEFNQLWNAECSFLIRTSTRLLWISSTVAVLLTAMTFGLWLANRPGQDMAVVGIFIAIVLGGIFVPATYAMRVVRRRRRVALATGDATGLRRPVAQVRSETCNGVGRHFPPEALDGNRATRATSSCSAAQASPARNEAREHPPSPPLSWTPAAQHPPSPPLSGTPAAQELLSNDGDQSPAPARTWPQRVARALSGGLG